MHTTASCRLALAAALVLSMPPALANPTGPTPVSGIQSIAGVGGATVTVQQNAAHAIVDWTSFSNDAGELVRFIQPSASAAILNRVTGTSVSNIFGRIQADGRVLLVNPNGIVFGAGSQADMAGLVASTLSISNANFNSDHWQFDGVPDGTVPGRVNNDGTLTATSGGFVVLLGQGGVQNNTAITAPRGSILLASGSSIFVDPTGDGLVLYQVTAPTLNQYHYSGDTDPNQNDAGNDGVNNHGNLTADGGRVALETYNDFVTFAAVYNTGGTIRAQTASTDENGQIILTARGSGILQAGNLDASGPGNGSVSISSDKAVALRPPQDFGFPGDGSNPPSVIAHSFQMQSADFSPQNVTVAADSIDLRSSGDFNFGGVAVKGQRSANPTSVRLQGSQLELGGVTLTAPALTLVATGTPSDSTPDGGRITLGNDTLSGQTLVMQGANLDIRTSLDYTTSISLTGSTRISIDAATIGGNTPGAVSFSTPREVVINASTINATALTALVGTDHVQFDDGFNVHDSALNATSMQITADGMGVDGTSALTTTGLMDLHANLDIRAAPVHAGSLQVTGGAFLEDDDVQTAAGMQFDSGNLQVRGTTLTGTTLAVNGSGAPSEFDLTPSATTGNAAAASFSQSIALDTGVIVIGEAAVHAPQITLAANGGGATGLSDLFLSGVKLDGNMLQAQATGIDIRGGSVMPQSTLDFVTSLALTSVGRTVIQDTVIGGQAVSPVRITAGENIQLQSTTIHAGDLTLRAAYGTTDGNNGILMTTSHLTGDVVLLDSHGSIADDLTNADLTSVAVISTIDAQGLGLRAGSGMSLYGTGITVGAGLAPFGRDDGLLQELAALAPSRVPLASGPNLAISSQLLALGKVNMAGDYLFVSADNPVFLAPFQAPTSLFVNLRPHSPRGMFHLDQGITFGHDTHISVAEDQSGNQIGLSLNSTFPGTTYVFGGTGYDGVIFAGESGPIDFGSHDSGVFFMTNSAVVKQSSISSSGPQGTLDGIEGTPPDSAQNEDELKGGHRQDSTDAGGNNDHQVDRVSSPAAAKECT